MFWYVNREDLQLPNALLVCFPTPLGRPPGAQSRYLIARPRTIGPIEPTQYPGLKSLIVVFVDNYSRFAIVYSVKSKDEAGEALKKYLVSAHKLLGKD